MTGDALDQLWFFGGWITIVIPALRSGKDSPELPANYKRMGGGNSEAIALRPNRRKPSQQPFLCHDFVLQIDSGQFELQFIPKHL